MAVNVDAPSRLTEAAGEPESPRTATPAAPARAGRRPPCDGAIGCAPADATDQDAISCRNDDTVEPATGDDTAPRRQRRLAAMVGVCILTAILALTSWLGYSSYKSQRAEDLHHRYLQTAKQAALDLTTIDWQQVDTQVRRILDEATDPFRGDFAKQSQTFADVVKKAQSKSVGTITDAGLESETSSGAHVLVAVTVRSSVAGAPEQDPRVWRMRISVDKTGDQMKVDGVSFVS